MEITEKDFRGADRVGKIIIFEETQPGNIP
jgi:hypothetical protein